ARAAPADISLEQLSNPWPLSVGASPSNGGGAGNGPNVAISFWPSPVPNPGGGTWNHSVTISEIGGASVTLTSLNVGGTESSSRISVFPVKPAARQWKILGIIHHHRKSRRYDLDLHRCGQIMVRYCQPAEVKPLPAAGFNAGRTSVHLPNSGPSL